MSVVNRLVRPRLWLELDQRGDQEVHRQDPDQDHSATEPEIPRAVMIPCHLRVAIKEPLADTKDVKAAEENDREQKTENDAKRRDESRCS